MINVIFDMDGVIFDSENMLLNCWLDVADKNGLDREYVRDAYIRCIGTNDRQTREIYEAAFLPLLGKERLYSIWDESKVLFQERHGDGRLPIKPGVREILDFLKAQHIRTGIASSSKKSTVERQIGVAGLTAYFSNIIGGDAVTISKPNPEIYLIACRELDVDPADTFAIEDSFNGIRAAHAAGLRPIMVPDIIPADNEMKHLSEVVCADLYEAKEWIQKQMKG